MGKVIIASGPVIVKDNKVLLNISGNDDFWKFCGGRVSEGENLRETAIRRAKEELGITVEIVDNKPFIIAIAKPGEEEVDVLLVHYLSKIDDEVVPGEMVKKWDWVDIDNLPDNVGPNIMPALKHFGYK